MFDTQLTVVGNLVDDPVLRRTGNGTPVAKFRIASTSRRKVRESEEWVDGDSLYLNVSCWREMASRVAAVLRKGDSLVVVGRLVTREYTVGEEIRRSYEVDARAIGPNMARADVNVARREPGVQAYETVGYVNDPVSDAAIAGLEQSFSDAGTSPEAPASAA